METAEEIQEYEAFLRSQRMGIAPVPRMLLLTGIGGATGFFRGLFRGASRAGLQFRAENAHRQPKTQNGWYYYHRAKNYKMVLAAFRSGTWNALQLGGLVGVYTGTEAGIDFLRASPMYHDFLSSMASGVTTAAVASLSWRLNRHAFLRNVRWGALAGASIGLAQDLAAYSFRGQKLWFLPS
jgi:hypothetical protein